MNGQTEQTTLKEMSCHSSRSNFGLACHLSDGTGDRKYAIKAVSVEGTAWTVSKDTHSSLATFEVWKSQHFSLGSWLAGSSNLPNHESLSDTPPGWKWRPFSGPAAQAAENQVAIGGLATLCPRKQDKVTMPPSLPTYIKRRSPGRVQQNRTEKRLVEAC